MNQTGMYGLGDAERDAGKKMLRPADVTGRTPLNGGKSAAEAHACACAALERGCAAYRARGGGHCTKPNEKAKKAQYEYGAVWRRNSLCGKNKGIQDIQ